jgi:hypothetical protein
LLRLLSFAVDNDNNVPSCGRIFGEDRSEDDLEAVSKTETEFDADFLNRFKGETDTEVVATNTTLSFFASGHLFP